MGCHDICRIFDQCWGRTFLGEQAEGSHVTSVMIEYRNFAKVSSVGKRVFYANTPGYAQDSQQDSQQDLLYSAQISI